MPTPKPNRWHPCLLPDDYLRKLKQDIGEVEAKVEAETRYEPDPDAPPSSDDDPSDSMLPTSGRNPQRQKGTLMMNRFVLLSFLLAAAGCGPKGPAQTVENYFPLAVGNQWIYTTEGDTAAETLSIAESFLNASNVRVYKRVSDGPGAVYFAYTGGKVIALSNPNDTAGPIILSEPFEVGATWTWKGAAFRITDTEAGVATPAGNFSVCLKVTDPDTFDSYYAPGVGLVKVVDPDGDEVMRLSEYDVK